jgi:hypothetical protein
MPNRNCRADVAIAIVVLIAAPVSAHSVHVQWKLTATQLVVVASFSDDWPADDAEVTLRDSANNVVATGKTDDTGTWKGERPGPGSYRLTVKAFANHEKTISIEIEPAADEATQNEIAPRVWLIAAAVLVVALLSVFGMRRLRRKERIGKDAEKGNPSPSLEENTPGLPH